MPLLPHQIKKVDSLNNCNAIFDLFKHLDFHLIMITELQRMDIYTMATIGGFNVYLINEYLSQLNSAFIQ